MQVYNIAWRVLLDNKKQNKQKTQNKHSLKDSREQFFKVSFKNIIYEKIIPFDAALLLQKARCRQVTLNEVLNKYDLRSRFL